MGLEIRVDVDVCIRHSQLPGTETLSRTGSGHKDIFISITGSPELGPWGGQVHGCVMLSNIHVLSISAVCSVGSILQLGTRQMPSDMAVVRGKTRPCLSAALLGVRQRLPKAPQVFCWLGLAHVAFPKPIFGKATVITLRQEAHFPSVPET